MPEKAINNPVNIEEVDKCMENVPNCLSNLDNLDDKTRLNIIVSKMINNMSSYVQIEKNKNTDKYNIKLNGYKLNIGFNIKQLEQIGPILIKLYNTDIQLFGSFFERSINEDTFMLDGLEDKYIDSKNYNLSKNDIEEIFIFIMKAKGIPMEDWKIEPTVCANQKVDNSCKQDLGNKKGS